MTVIVMTNIIDRSSVMIVFLLVQQAVSFGGTNYFPTQTHSTLKQYVPPCFFHRYLMHGPRHTPIPLQVTMDSSPSTGFIEDAKEDNTNENNEDTSRDPIKPEQFHHSNSNGKRRPQRNNVAMGDTAFLRKRTTDLLRVTSGEFLSNTSDMESNHNNSLSRRMKVGRKTFNFLIDAWAFSGELDAADHALRLLERMEFLQDCSPDFISSAPDVRSYTKVINAISRSARPDAGDIAEEILNKMEYLYSSGANLSAKPNTFTYTTVIEAYANSGSEGSAEKAEAILDRMIARFQAGDTDVTPTARSFNAAITAYGKCGGSGAAQRAEEIFHRMDAIYMSGIEEAKPSTFNYNALITALANSGEEGSAQRAAEVLERMEQCYASGDLDCRPTTVSFNAVIDAYAKSGEEHSASRAEQVLRHMEDLYESGEEVRPNTRSFNSVLNAYAKSGEETGALKAQDLLDFMSSLYERGNEAVRPDVHSYCTVINAWARSQQPGKAERANNLFRAMVQAYESGNTSLRPNVIAVNAVMNACAYTSGDVMAQNRAMEIAHKRFKDLESSKYGTPDQVTYGTFLKVCANQMPDCSTRQQIIEVVFKKCVRDGQVGNLVLQQLKAMGPPSLYYKLIGRDMDSEIRMEDLPTEWWCNVVEGKWRRRRQF